MIQLRSDPESEYPTVKWVLLSEEEEISDIVTMQVIWFWVHVEEDQLTFRLRLVDEEDGLKQFRILRDGLVEDLVVRFYDVDGELISEYSRPLTPLRVKEGDTCLVFPVDLGEK